MSGPKETKWKKVKVRAVIEYEVSVPDFYTKEDVEFHRNEGSWCADNLIDELQLVADEEGCLCGCTTFTYLGDPT